MSTVQRNITGFIKAFQLSLREWIGGLHDRIIPHGLHGVCGDTAG